jgi:hypothetical protein
MDNYEKFCKDLKSGEKYENIMIELLEESGFTFVRKSDPRNKVERKEYDLVMLKDGFEFTFEVKCDLFAYETENEVFEYNCSGTQSGIIATTSDYWITCHLLENRITMYKTNELKKLCKEMIIGSGKDYRLVRGGDGAKAKMILVNHEKMKEYLRNRRDLNYELPIFNVEQILKYLKSGKLKKYNKIISKLEEISK